MQIHLDEKPVAELECDALVCLTFEGKPNDRLNASLSDLYGSGEVTGKIFEMTLVQGPENFKARRLLLAGAWPIEKFTSAELRRESGAALRHLKSKSLRNMTRWLDCGFSGDGKIADGGGGRIG